MLTANAYFQVFLGRTTFVNTDFYELANAILIDGLERVTFKNSPFQVIPEERSRIITAKAQRQLGQVVGAEREEICFGGNFIGSERCSRNFDHRADFVINPYPFLFYHFFSGFHYYCFLVDQLCFCADQRDHDFRIYFHAFFGQVAGSFDDGPGLHLRDFGVRDTQTASPVSHHRVKFMQRRYFCLYFLQSDAHLFGHLLLVLIFVRQEFV